MGKRHWKHLNHALTALTAAAVLFIASCSSISYEDLSEPYLAAAHGLHGDEAAGFYEEAVAETETPQLYYNLAYFQLESGDAEAAITTADRALEIFPEYRRFRYLKAYALRSEKRYHAYEMELEGILAEDPGNMTIRTMLLDHYVTIGRKADAARIAREVLRRDPENRTALSALAPYSSFFNAIAPKATEAEKTRERLWTEPPRLWWPEELLGREDLSGISF